MQTQTSRCDCVREKRSQWVVGAAVVDVIVVELLHDFVVGTARPILAQSEGWSLGKLV